MEISGSLAKKILTENHIEMSIDDKRSPLQYVTELLVYIEEVNGSEDQQILEVKSDLL